MYELNCPACKHTVRRTFLRPGAQAVCSNCAHRFSIARENVKRLAAVPADTGQDRDNPLLLDGVVARPPQPHRASPSAAGRSPMVDRDETDMAGAALGDDPSPAATLKPLRPVHEHKEPSADVARVIARHRAARQRRGKLITIGVVCALAFIGFFVFVFTIMVSRNLSLGQAIGAAFGKEVKSTDDNLAISGLVGEVRVVHAERISVTFWQDLEQVQVYDEKMPQSQVQLEGTLVAESPQRSVYVARIKAGGMNVTEKAIIHLMLVDENGLIFAKHDMPAMLLSGHPTAQEPRPMRIAVPQRLAERTKRVASWIEPTQLLQGGAMFNKVLYEPVRSGSHTALKITAFNPLGTAMQRAVFYIRAFNDRGETINRWSVQWNHGIDPRQRVEFAALMQVQESWQVTTWEVFGAGGLNSPEPAR